MTPFGEKIRSLAASIRCEKIHFVPVIPQKKLNNLRNSCRQFQEEVYALYDDTVWGGGADGMMLTDSGVWWHNYTEEAEFLSWEDLLQHYPSFPQKHVLSVSVTPGNKISASESQAVYDLLSAALRFKREESGSPVSRGAPGPSGAVCMVECAYCGSRYDRSKGNCPGCGAPPLP